MSKGKVTGIICVGPFYTGTGYSTLAINFVKGLHKVGYPVRAVNYGGPALDLLAPDIKGLLSCLEKADVGSYPICVIFYTPPSYRHINTKGVVKRIGAVITETDCIVPSWAEQCNDMDEIWVPTQGHLEAFVKSGVHREKLRVVPYNFFVNTDYFSPGVEPLHIEKKKGLTFLSVFTCDWRKGFNLLVEAYFSEFSNKDNVTLVLKALPGYGAPNTGVKERILGSVKHKFDIESPNIPNLIILDKWMTMDELRQLYSACDLYISTDYARNVSYNCLEAMACGKPAASVNWSSNPPFVFEGNPLTINTTGRLVDIDERTRLERGDVYQGQKWEEVKVEEIRRVMRFAYDNRDELSEIAKKEYEYVVKNCSVKAMARKIVNIVDSIDISDSTISSHHTPEVKIMADSIGKKGPAPFLSRLIKRVFK